MSMSFLEKNHTPTYPGVAQRIAGMALEAMHNPRVALADLARPSERHAVSEHVRSTYAALIGSLGLRSGDVQ